MVKDYPFQFSKNQSLPIGSRHRSAIRTKSNFEPVEKLNIDTPDVVEAKKIAANPYLYNRTLRAKTKSTFAKDQSVRHLLSQNDGFMQ